MQKVTISDAATSRGIIGVRCRMFVAAFFTFLGLLLCPCEMNSKGDRSHQRPSNGGENVTGYF
jgi:hypothetical protein